MIHVPRSVLALTFVVICGCGDGLLSPKGSDAGPFEPLPDHETFLDVRIAGCPTAAEIASVSDIRVYWDAAATSAPLVCTAAEGSADLSRIQKRIYFALILMKELRFDAPLPWTDKTIYEWFRETASGVRYTAGDGNSNTTTTISVQRCIKFPFEIKVSKLQVIYRQCQFFVCQVRPQQTGFPTVVKHL